MPGELSNQAFAALLTDKPHVKIIVKVLRCDIKRMLPCQLAAQRKHGDLDSCRSTHLQLMTDATELVSASSLSLVYGMHLRARPLWFMHEILHRISIIKAHCLTF